MSTSQHQEPLLMSQSEAAALLGVSRNTLVRLVKRGVLAKVKIAPGMMPRVRREDVVALAKRPEGSP
jgi:excisionase family DNA binding protein